MKPIKYFLTAISVCFCFGCGNTRLKLISEHSGLRLPKDYEVLENTTEDVWPDYEINITLKFDSISFDSIKIQLDSLKTVGPKWTESRNTYEYAEEISNEPESIIINKTNRTLKYNLVHL